MVVKLLHIKALIINARTEGLELAIVKAILEIQQHHHNITLIIKHRLDNRLVLVESHCIVKLFTTEFN